MDLIERLEARIAECEVWNNTVYNQDEANLRELLEAALEKIKEFEGVALNG